MVVSLLKVFYAVLSMLSVRACLLFGEGLSLIEVQHLNVQYCKVFAFQFALLGGKQVVLAVHQLNDVLQSHLELLAQHFVAGLLTLAVDKCGTVFCLISNSLNPVAFDS